MRRREPGADLGRRFADLADAQVSLSAQVAETYVSLRYTQERQRLNAESITLQRQGLDLAEQRDRAGTMSSLDIERLRTQLENMQSQTLPLAAQAEEDLNRLAVLTGRAPGALDSLLAAPAPIPLPPEQVAIGDPAALIAQRPDIRSAERALAASTAAIGVQKASLLPSISFTGLLGLGGSRPGDVLDPENLSGLALPMLSWSVLDFGRGRATVREAEAKRGEAQALYRQAVLGALEDAETSLSRFGNSRRQLARLVMAERSASRAAALNGQRVEAGTSALIDQLDIERQRIAATIAVAQSKAQLTGDYIGVSKSLGLGWTRSGCEAPAGIETCR